jgi:hypothetical protein
MTGYSRKLTAFLFGVSVLFGAPPAQVTSRERVSFAPGGLIRLDTASGNLFVEAWDGPEIEITTVKSTRQDQAARCFETVRVATERRSSSEWALSDVVPSRSFLSTLFGRGCGVTVDHQIRVPRDSRLVIHHGAGYVLVSRVTGEIEATSRSADIMLMLPGPGPYSIDAKSKFGNVASDFSGANHRTKLMGEQFAGANPPPARRIYLRIGFGGITIKEVPPTPEAPVAAEVPEQ